MAANTNIVFDFRGTISSMSLLKVTQVFRKMKPSEVIEIRGTDPDTRQDLFKVLPKETYEIIYIEDVDNNGDLGWMKIRKCR